MAIFKESSVRTQCERCKTVFTVGHGGVCTECRRILCDAHLHGSFWLKLKRAVIRDDVCVECRAKSPRGATQRPR